jgi:hypothetical protein
MWRAGYGRRWGGPVGRRPWSRGRIGCLPIIIGVAILIALIVLIFVLLRH